MGVRRKLARNGTHFSYRLVKRKGTLEVDIMSGTMMGWCKRCIQKVNKQKKYETFEKHDLHISKRSGRKLK